MTKKVTIIDYGCGNIFSLERILKELNCTVEITNNFDEIVNAEKVILPGVGSFLTGIKNLKSKKLDGAITSFLHKGDYLLGICFCHLVVRSEREKRDLKVIFVIAASLRPTDRKRTRETSRHMAGWRVAGCAA